MREGQSVAQNLDRLFFGASDEMRNEFDRLFASLYKRESRHVEIVRLLGTRKIGMTRDEISTALGMRSGGELTKCLEELVACGFLRSYSPIGNQKRGSVFQLIDNYVLFYFKFIKGRKGNDPEYWSHHFNEPAVNVWRGLSFERVCFWHIPQIKAALGIAGIGADVYAWRGKSEGGDAVQIDMLLDRADRVVSICEMKYSDGDHLIDKEEEARIRQRLEVFRRCASRRRSVQMVLITSCGLKRNTHSSVVQNVVVADDLFR